MKKARNGFMNILSYLCLAGVIVLGLMTIVGTGGGGGGGGGGVPSNPQNVEALAGPGDGSITVSWDEVADATSYNLYWIDSNVINIDNANKLENVGSPFVHSNLPDNITYSYIVTALNTVGESDPSASVNATTRPPLLSGSTLMAPLAISYENGLNAGGVSSVCIYDLAFNNPPICDYNSDPECNCDYQRENNEVIYTDERDFSFSVNRGEVYIISVSYGGGQHLSAITPTITQDTVQDVTLDTEVAMNLITVLEKEHNGIDPSDLSPLANTMDSLLNDANLAVEKLNLFNQDRNLNRDVDRFVEAVRNYTLDKLNQGKSVYVGEIEGSIIRSYGGGIDYLPTLDEILDNPKTPLNPHFLFTRVDSNTTESIAMSDLEAVRWDYLEANAKTPHVPIGGTKVTYAAANPTYNILSVYIKDMGQDNAQILTPDDLYCITPVLSPDMSKIVFAGKYVDVNWNVDTLDNYPSPFNLFVIDADGTNLLQLTEDTYYPSDPSQALFLIGSAFPDWSQDGEWVAYGYHFYVDDLGDPFYINGIVKIKPISPDPAINEQAGINDFGSTNILSFMPCWTPDGKQILYTGWHPDYSNGQFTSYFYDIDRDKTSFYISDHSRYYQSISHDGKYILYVHYVTDDMRLRVIDRYTGDLVYDYGNFADAADYSSGRFTATEAALVALAGTTTDENGNVIIDPDDDQRVTGGGSSSYNYYREIIPAANTMGMNFNVTSWW